MKIILCDINQSIIDAVGKVDRVDVICGNLFEQEFDALITPGNSFGFMDGNFDLLVSQRYGWHIQEQVRNIISASWHEARKEHYEMINA